MGKTSGMAITSLVLGLCSLLLFWTFIIPILSIVFGFIGLNDIKQNKNLQGKGMAIAGIVLGFIWFALLLLIILLGIFWVILRNIFLGSI